MGVGNRRQTCICQGVTATGASLNKVINVTAGAATGSTYPIYTTAEDVVMIHCVFGGMDSSINELGNHTTVTLARTNTGITFFGTLTSTYNQ